MQAPAPLADRLLVVLSLAFAALATAAQAAPPKLDTTADHSTFKALQQPFASGPEVTRACLGCHTEAARQIHRTTHWTWDFAHPQTGQRLGKKTLVNNYCISIASNQSACTTCHVGYGWKDNGFDFASQDNVDCLVCHDTSGAYRKAPGLAGHVIARDAGSGSGTAAKGVDLAKVAQKVGKTSRDTCGACHFFGGGGDGVKRGDLDSSMAAPDRELDVHMDATGLDFSCATCHRSRGHEIAGSRYVPTAKNTADGAHMRGDRDAADSPVTCVSCHGSRPHPNDARLDRHATKVACQTCHIPAFARGGVATKTSWDWSVAGERDADGRHVVRKDAKGHVVYESRKGAFTVGENVRPEYAWFNGDVRYTLLGDRIEPGDGPVPINTLGGDAYDGRSLIWPMKVFRGRQPYDPVNRTFVTPHTAGDDDTGYWKNLVWDKAIAVGMADAGAPFSGQVAFVDTVMRWPITHMVAPKDRALGCPECHSRAGRLAGIDGVYLPGRDAEPWIERTGWTLAALSLLAVLAHAALRAANRRRR